MGNVKIPYYIVKNGRGYWNPNKPEMRAAGFRSTPCGADGPDAWRIARECATRWQAYRKGIAVPQAVVWPRGSLGEAFDRFRGTETWKAKAPKTREEWERMWRIYIAPIFGDVALGSVTLERLDRWYAKLLTDKGIATAHRTVKIWRALWQVGAALRYCSADEDPSFGIRRKTPRPRTEVWSEGELVRLVKGAWRRGYHGLAVLLAIAWDTQFSPVDARKLTVAQLIRHPNRRLQFRLARAKTGAPAIGTLCARSAGLLDAYLAELGVDVHPAMPILRNRAGAPYTKETLNKDFAKVRAAVMGAAETRRIMDLRRSGAVEAMAGEVDAGALAAKMANTINNAQTLQRTYLPVDPASVVRADEARRRGRRRLRSGEQKGGKSQN